MQTDHIHSLSKWVRAHYTGGGTDEFTGLLNQAARRYQERNGRTLSLRAIKRELGRECARMRYAKAYKQLTLF